MADNIKAERRTTGEAEGGAKWEVGTGVTRDSLTEEQKEALKSSRQFATKEEHEEFLKGEDA